MKVVYPLAEFADGFHRLGAGEDIARPAESMLAERERVTEEHRALVPHGLRRCFDESLALASQAAERIVLLEQDAVVLDAPAAQALADERLGASYVTGP